ncbi:MAG: hypothetical protein HY749_05365 [Gammaproteobacteria bacterium]|nr:hypothetical protein [Gammaproteobacteria bacterium]
MVALAARRHMQLYVTRSEDFAENRDDVPASRKFESGRDPARPADTEITHPVHPTARTRVPRLVAEIEVAEPTGQRLPVFRPA